MLRNRRLAEVEARLDGKKFVDKHEHGRRLFLAIPVMAVGFLWAGSVPLVCLKRGLSMNHSMEMFILNALLASALVTRTITGTPFRKWFRSKN